MELATQGVRKQGIGARPAAAAVSSLSSVQDRHKALDSQISQTPQSAAIIETSCVAAWERVVNLPHLDQRGPHAEETTR